MAKTNLLPGARKEYQARLSGLRLKDDELPAILGDGQGNCRIDQTHSWARVEGRGVMQVWNDRVPHIDEWEVIVGYEAGENLFRVLRAREPYQERPYAMLGEHGAAHSMFHPDGGHDIAWIDIRQWMPWRVFPSSAFTVSVWYGMAYRNGSWSSNEVQTLNLSASQPADGARYVLITLDEDGVLTATAGSTVADKFVLTDSDIPAVPSGHYPLAVVRLYDTQTKIQEQRDDTDIIDLRYPPYTTMAPASASGSIAWENVVIVAASGGDYATIQGGHSATPSGGLTWGAPGTYAENITLVAGRTLAGMSPSEHAGDMIIQPASGVPVTTSAVSGHEVIFARILPAASTIGVQMIAGATRLVLGGSRVEASGAAAVDASGADATAELFLLDCFIVGAVNAKAITVIRGCDITGNVVQSVGAGNLTIDGGNIDGNLTHVAGSTITLRNLPRIGGTVSGAGTIVGAYLNSSGHIVFVNGTAMSGFANPTAQVGPTAINGVAATAMRSDAAPAINLGAAYVWTGLHTFNAGLDAGANTFIDALTDGIGGGFRAGASSDVLWYRNTFDWWRTPDSVIVDGVVLIGTTASFGSEFKLQVADNSEAFFSSAVYNAAAATAGAWIVRRARGTIASPSIVASGDLIGQFRFDVHDGVGLSPTASIRGYVDGTPGANDLPSRLEFYTTPDGSATQVLGAALKSTGQFQLPVTGIAAGLVVGTTTQLYESASNVLRTPDSFTIDGQLNVGSPSVNNSGISIGGAVTTFLMDETDASANNRLWEWFVNGEQLICRVVNDAYSAAGNWCYVDRTGTTIDSVTFPNGTVLMGSHVSVNGATTPKLRMKEIVVAQDAAGQLGVGASVFGLAFVVDHTEGQSALFATNVANNTAYEIADPQGVYSVTKDTASSTNVYYDSGNARWEIQNKRTGSHAYAIYFFDGA